MRSRLLACGFAALVLSGVAGGCAGRPGGAGAGIAAGTAPAVAARPADAKAAAKLVSRSVWGVVPDPPRYKKDLRPELIRGSAVAVSDGTLLASCRLAGGRQRVGLVRHNKYEIARVRAADPGRAVCVLEVVADDARRLSPARGFRSLADLRVGEPVYAVVSRTSAEFAVAEGRVTGTRAAATGGGGGALRTSVALPAGARGAVLVDGLGNLVGFGSGPPAGGGASVAAPVPPRAVTRLANRDLGEAAAVRLAALPSPPRAGDGRAPVLILFRDEPDRDDGDRPAAPAAVATAAGAGPYRSGPEPDVGDAPSRADLGQGAGRGGPETVASDGRGPARGGDGGRGDRGGRDRDERGGRGGGLGDSLGGLGGLGAGGRGGLGRGGGHGRGDDGDRGKRGGDDDDDGGGGGDDDDN
jgi:hypothetical protein